MVFRNMSTTFTKLSVTATLNQRTTPAKPEVSFCHTITLSSRPPHPRATTDLLSVPLHWFAFPGILYKQNHTTFLALASFTLRNHFEMHTCFSLYQLCMVHSLLLLSSMPFVVWTCRSLSVTWLIRNKTAINAHVHAFVWTVYDFLYLV